MGSGGALKESEERKLERPRKVRKNASFRGPSVGVRVESSALQPEPWV